MALVLPPQQRAGRRAHRRQRRALPAPLLRGGAHSGTFDAQTFDHYVQAFSDPARLRASMEDYRTGFTDDLDRDQSDHARGLRLRLHAQLLLLWGAEGWLADEDVVGIWQDHHAGPAVVNGHPVPGGHYVPEEAPQHLLRAVTEFLEKQ